MNKKSLDQLIQDFNSLDIVNEVPPVNLDKMIKEYKERNQREQKGNRKNLIAALIIGISLYYLLPQDTYSQINFITLAILLLGFFFSSKYAEKRMDHIDMGQSSVDYEKSKKETVKILLKQFHFLNFAVYFGIFVTFTNLGIRYYQTHDWIVFWGSLPLMIFGAWFALRATRSAIKEYKEIIQE